MTGRAAEPLLGPRGDPAGGSAGLGPGEARPGGGDRGAGSAAADTKGVPGGRSAPHLGRQLSWNIQPPSPGSVSVGPRSSSRANAARTKSCLAEVEELPANFKRGASDPWVPVERPGEQSKGSNSSDSQLAFQRWQRISARMGARIPKRIGRETLHADFIGTITRAAVAPGAAAADCASKLCDGLAELGEISGDIKQDAFQDVLQLFILHYIFLFAFQAFLQVGVTTSSFVNIFFLDSDILEIVLTAIDWVLVLLLMVELLSQVCVVGRKQFMSLPEHRIDLLILVCSLTFCLFDTLRWFKAPAEGGLIKQVFESVKMTLRCLRIYAFTGEIYVLLNEPIHLVRPASNKGSTTSRTLPGP